MKIEDLATRIVAREPRLSEKELDGFEKSTGYHFPDDYRSFLNVAGGGGEVSLSDVEYLEFKKSRTTYYPSIFCSLGSDEYHDIRPLQKHFEDLEHAVARTPSGIFTIADDGMGNFLTIDLRADSFGQIAIVDHETIGDNFADPETYEIVAETFTEFVKKLRLKRQIYVVEMDGKVFNLENKSDILSHLDYAFRKKQALKLIDEGRWIKFVPHSFGGYYYWRAHEMFGVSQGYYPSSSPHRTIIKKALGQEQYILQIDHIRQLFENFFGVKLNDLGIMMRELS